MTEPQAARNASLPFPEVFGLGVTTATLEVARSGQSRIPAGLPLRTTNTIVDVYGLEWFGRRDGQPSAMRPRLRTRSMSEKSARVTTSASAPSLTARAWWDEPPCDWMTVTFCPVRAR